MKPEKEWRDWIELKDRAQPTVVTRALPVLLIGAPDRQDIFSMVNTNATKGVLTPFTACRLCCNALLNPVVVVPVPEPCTMLIKSTIGKCNLDQDGQGMMIEEVADRFHDHLSLD